MKHIEMISAYIKTLMISESFHALVIQSLPGWGKSTTIDQAVKNLKLPVVIAGSYATPLHIYNNLCENPDSLVIFDDCAGIFSDPKAMAILKAATWQSTTSSDDTSGNRPTRRRVAWGSSTERTKAQFVDFSGKLILLTNTLPAGKETEAFLSRCLSYRIAINENEIKEMLIAAASSKTYFPKADVSKKVAIFLTDGSNNIDLQRTNLRTLKLGYDLALSHSELWHELFLNLLPRKEKPKDIVSQILHSPISAREQEAQFIAKTGLSRRTFYNHKRKMGLTRPYTLAK